MTTRLFTTLDNANLFTTLDHSNYTANNMPKRLSKLTISDLQEVYVPAQPVLSCRTVDIDLPGTRTYRQKSTLDILEAHQKLIRHLCSKHRDTVSAPPRERRAPSPRPPSEHSINKCNIEIKGRPLTPASVSSSYQPQPRITSTPQQRRPKTTGHAKNVHSMIDSYMVIGEDKDLSAISQSSLDLNNKLHSYWKPDKNILNTGKFMRDQKRTDNVSSTLGAWLSFYGTAEDNNDGIINAFTSFTNSREFYSIEGSVGSQVARQLQKGGTVRIGINGVLQSQDSKRRRWNQGNIPFVSEKTNEGVTKKISEELKTRAEESTAQFLMHEDELIQEPKMQETEETKQEEPVIDFPSFGSHLDDDFHELVISSLDDVDAMKIKVPRPVVPKRSDVPADPAVESPVPNEEAVMETVRLTTPLSWSDQCLKSNIKIIYARVSDTEIPKPVASETFPVKFEKLMDKNSRPKLAESRPGIYKIKQRSPHNNDKQNASKVRVVCINPLTSEDEDRANQLSIEKIISHKLEEKNKENSAILLTCDIKYNSGKPNGTNNEKVIPYQSHRTASSRSEPRTNFSAFYNNLFSSHSDNHSAKMKVTPVHSSPNPLDGNLRILSAGSQVSPRSKDFTKTTRGPGKISPVKPLHRTVACQGSSIRSGLPQKERNYIKITSQLKIASTSTPVVNLSHRPTNFNISKAPVERSAPQNLDHQFIDKINLESETPESSAAVSEINLANIIHSSKKPIHTQAADIIQVIDDNCKNVHFSKEIQSPISSSVPISIPTADEESFCQSSKYGTSDDLTVKQPDNGNENVN